MVDGFLFSIHELDDSLYFRRGPPDMTESDPYIPPYLRKIACGNLQRYHVFLQHVHHFNYVT